MGYKDDFESIKRCVESLKINFNFKGLLHFTDFSNLKNILDNGYLYSRDYCEKNIQNFIDGANHDVLDRASKSVHESVRFYYRGKTPTLYNNEGIKLKDYCKGIHVPIPVYLLFDEELIYLDSTEFSNGNATNSERGKTALFFRDIDWRAVFHCTSFSPEERDYIVNKRQAELLSCIPVSLKYLKEIIFRCEADKKRALNLFGNDTRYKVDISLFSDKNFNECYNEKEKNNFIKDYNIQFNNYNKNSILLNIEYQKPWQNYETKLKILDSFGKNITEYTQNIYYKTIFGTILNESETNNEIQIFELTGNISKWFKLEVYVNDILCIEEFLIKYDMLSYDISYFKDKDTKPKMMLKGRFANNNFLKYTHKFEVFNNDNKLIYHGIIKFREKSLNWNVKFNNFNHNWYRVKYYINNVLCINEKINYFTV